MGHSRQLQRRRRHPLPRREKGEQEAKVGREALQCSDKIDARKKRLPGLRGNTQKTRLGEDVLHAWESDARAHARAHDASDELEEASRLARMAVPLRRLVDVAVPEKAHVVILLLVNLCQGFHAGGVALHFGPLHGAEVPRDESRHGVAHKGEGRVEPLRRRESVALDPSRPESPLPLGTLESFEKGARSDLPDNHAHKLILV
mmetsp:Transcript_25901/g.58056  ORF Transcript_25901/g.58056 Transcript_25901/m.58056 type:complete len:203 (+) Transcript_25901:500-1108(+)|eukprot:CAMPEP_0172611258 /NCGR_PEP_ID=MMETSP1068-20121228/30973_1 /TAXON_ID=35684 /ORGANISM="Pseudopedinella elastica, Strain CCMP716" /LENGTH=202 /DNA_ID=CAMNT_0013415185 /DNA_START=476 /DNA_END=1084 /DNA_ORIENTATION=-